MNSFRVVIIGAGIAGTTAAEALRGADPDATIALVGDEPHNGYSRLSLSKENYLLEKLPEEALWLKNDSFYESHKITYFKGVTATGLDPEKKEVTLSNGEILSYEKLLLALGGTPRLWNIPGSDKTGIHYFRTIDDARAVLSEFKTLRHALLIGGGFISFELAHILRSLGIATTVLLRGSYYWNQLLDEESGRLIEDSLKKNGVEVIYEDEVVEVRGASLVQEVVTKIGRTLATDFILVGIGVQTPHGPFSKAGLACNTGILADRFLKTNLPDVWAAGDCAEYDDPILHEKVQLGNWANAMLQGRCAAMNMAGHATEFRNVSTYTTVGLGLSICFIGNVRPGPDKEVITRGSRAAGKVTRLLILNNRVVGATLLNGTEDMPWVSKLIRDQKDVSALKNTLADPTMEGKSFL